MAFIIHGIGTMVYGHRLYWPDGSYITTECFVVAWVPIIPLCSKRISEIKTNDFAKYDASGGFYLYETMGVDYRQAQFVYLWFACLFGPSIIWAGFEGTLKKLGLDDLAEALCLGFSALAFVFPYFLRRWVKRRKCKRMETAELGAARVKCAQLSELFSSFDQGRVSEPSNEHLFVTSVLLNVNNLRQVSVLVRLNSASLGGSPRCSSNRGNHGLQISFMNHGSDRNSTVELFTPMA